MRKRRYRITDDENVFLLGPKLRQMSRVFAVLASSFVIMVPTLVIPSIASSGGRVACSVFSAVLFMSVIAFTTRARTVEIFAAGAR
jgi:phytoene dehydrogenase-like protein